MDREHPTRRLWVRLEARRPRALTFDGKNYNMTRGPAILLATTCLLSLLATSGQAGALHDAISRSDLATARSILDNNPDLINAKDDFAQFTPLLVAVQEDDREMIEFLLSRNADINAACVGGNTALRWAVTLGHLDTAHFLVDHGARIDIFAAASFGDTQTVSRLLTEDPGLANPAQPVVRKPIHLAARDGHKDVVALLVNEGANPNEAGIARAYPLHEAARYGRADVVKYLLSLNVDVDPLDRDKRTPLDLASQYGDATVVQLLLNAGASVQSRNWRGNTPLHCAVLGNHADAVALLLQHKAEVNTLSDDGTPLHITAWSNGNADIAEMLISHGADVNAQDKNGRTPLQRATEYGKKAVAEVLLSHGASK